MLCFAWCAVKPRVLLADDHTALREALGELLAGETDLVGQVSDGRQLVETAGRLSPDIVVTDLAMPEMTGLEAMRHLKAGGSTARFIILTVDRDPRVASETIRAGASGYVFKQDAGEELLDAIRAVMAGGTFLSRQDEPEP
jgi:DNA-binding NarL/FixJ family response regulator